MQDSVPFSVRLLARVRGILILQPSNRNTSSMRPSLMEAYWVRIRRVRCDERRPKCASCTKRNMACHYELNPAGMSHSVGNADSLPGKPHYERSWLDGLPYRQPGYRSGSQDEQLWAENEGTAKYRRGLYELQLATYASSGPWYNESFFTGPVPVWLIPEGWAAFEAVHFCKSGDH